MVEKVERVGVKLNKLTIIALKEYKKEFYENEDLSISDGNVVASAYDYILNDIPKIDWIKVNIAPVPNVTNSNDDVVAYNATLSILTTPYEGLRELQSELRNVYEGRVFFSYVIKLVLFAALLKKNNLLEQYFK